MRQPAPTHGVHSRQPEAPLNPGRALATLLVAIPAFVSCDDDHEQDLLSGTFPLIAVEGTLIPIPMGPWPPPRGCGPGVPAEECDEEPSGCFFVLADGHLQLAPREDQFEMVTEFKDSCTNELLSASTAAGFYTQNGPVLHFAPDGRQGLPGGVYDGLVLDDVVVVQDPNGPHTYLREGASVPGFLLGPSSGGN